MTAAPQRQPARETRSGHHGAPAYRRADPAGSMVPPAQTDLPEGPSVGAAAAAIYRCRRRRFRRVGRDPSAPTRCAARAAGAAGVRRRPSPTAKDPLMADPATACTGPPWTAEDRVLALWLSVELRPHRCRSATHKVPVATVEPPGWKATSQFDQLTSRDSRLPRRPDAVRVCASSPWSRAATYSPPPLAETSDWGARDPDGGHSGQNLLGLALMQVRDERPPSLSARRPASQWTAAHHRTPNTHAPPRAPPPRQGLTPTFVRAPTNHACPRLRRASRDERAPTSRRWGRRARATPAPLLSRAWHGPRLPANLVPLRPN